MDRNSQDLFSTGAFRNPFGTIGYSMFFVPSGGTLWIQPGEYTAVATYGDAMTLRAPLGAVLLSNASGAGPGTSFDCCDPGPQRNEGSTEPDEPVELQ